MSYNLIIRSNAASTSDILVRDLGFAVPSGGAALPAFTTQEELTLVAESNSLRTLATVDAFGPGQHSIILNDGTNDVAAANVEIFLTNLEVSQADSAYGLDGTDAAGQPP